ncbi:MULTISPECIES: NUDIX hydrolase [Alteribacter]|uniref:NUDIX hydrolase n=1 Tax=Alteribacter TaxID=2823237 RepID=UPI0016066342|nr:NUDIX hydrolase [Alteribacter keqinensis]MBM7095696.1 NUDIX hydrolase [Alteribacter salitolerans]
MGIEERLLEWAKRLKAVSQTGLEYGNDHFDYERYKEMNDLSNEMIAYLSKEKIEEIERLLPVEKGYATPKMAVRAVVMAEGKLLMVKEAADGLWCLPGGWCDTGVTPGENIEKEVREETGLNVQATKLLAFFDQTKHRPSKTLQHIYTCYFKCEVTGGAIRGSEETTDVGFFSPDALPPLSIERMTKQQLDVALKEMDAGSPSIYFD